MFDRWLPRRSRETGAGTLEYVGMTVLVATLLGVVLTTGPRVFAQLPPAFKTAVCNVLTAMGIQSCSAASGTSRASQLPCLTERQNRKFGYHVTAFSVRGDRSLNDRLSVYGGNRANVTLYGGAGLGGEGMTGAKALSKGLSASGHVSVTGQYGFRYDFRSEKRARNFLQAKRGGLERYAKLLTPGSTGISAAMDALRHEIGPALGCQSCASDERMPDAVVAEVGLEARGEGGFNGQGASANAAAKLSGTGTVTYDLDTRRRTFRAELKGKGMLQAGLSPQQLPAEVRGTAGGIGNTALEVTFGPEGQPKTLTLVTKHGYSYGVRSRVEPQAIPGQQAGLSVKRQTGRLKVNTARLDLTKPRNRAAFNSLFQSVGGSAVIPKPKSPSDYRKNAVRLGSRLAADGLFTSRTYELDSAGGAGEAKSVGPANIKAGEGLTFGGGHQNDTRTVRLRSAEAMDMRNPNAHWSPMPTCNQGGTG